MHQRTRTAATWAAGIAAVAGGIMLAHSQAMPDRIKFPEGFEKGTLYTTVNRSDIKQFRELYTSAASVKSVRDGKGIPDGTVLTLVQYAAKVDDKGAPLRDAKGNFMKGDVLGYTVMEKRKGWGSTIPAEWRNGDWEYAAFTADKKPNAKANANTKACFDCHLPHAQQDFVISLAGLSGAAGGAAQRPAGPGTVAIAEFLFGPEKINVKAGQIITWTNVDDSPHQVTVQGASTLRTPVILKGQTTALQFNQEGSYGYICGLHPGMKGEIVVTK
jgi:plastocyanin